MKEVIIATTNLGKAREFEQLLHSKGYTVKTLQDYPQLEDVEETGSTFEENAIIKAESVSKALGVLVIADDSGLEIDALGGRPGVYSARYAGPSKNDDANIDKVLDEMEGIDESERTARFRCVLAVAAPYEKPVTFSGKCEGRILSERRGTHGFGYDPIFYVIKEGRAMAELGAEEKNAISHRAMALKELEKELHIFDTDGRNS
ncbi:XTP/dITP diphosphatase [Mesobacillus harenae]|uniref:XTP/dITP diphosphatase n=1 Tax=Mesobacillus harenae TaxID=2213203 RepID=UPI0015811FCA|nr:XTP/dITP diphosphatase [Mesobacillus harenae]